MVKMLKFFVVLQVEVPQSGMPGGLSRSSVLEAVPPKELLDQSGSNDFSAYKEIQDLKDACGVLRCVFPFALDISPPLSKVTPPWVLHAAAASAFSVAL